MGKKEKAEEADGKTPEVPKALEEIILNYRSPKYSAIPLAALWAKELRSREENRHLTPSELLELALREVLGGKVEWKDVKKMTNGATHDEDGEIKAKK